MLRVTLLSRILSDLTHGSCVSDLDVVNGGSLDLVSFFCTSISIVGLGFRKLVEAVRWCGPAPRQLLSHMRGSVQRDHGATATDKDCPSESKTTPLE